MDNLFFGYFIWGLLLAAPLWWIAWRFNIVSWLPRLRSLLRRRVVQLPPQIEPLVILGKRQHGGEGRKA
ncbi:hypothetical protein [Dyella amyloliquefaciens]|uniref:hypothetical protein n=1 Tax=Dyella amyloliquefaciens TaxID=1770545 RepID=UPI00102E89C8|nr:hypothetical protein [Dyella amyloliquefaciens]